MNHWFFSLRCRKIHSTSHGRCKNQRGGAFHTCISYRPKDKAMRHRLCFSTKDLVHTHTRTDSTRKPTCFQRYCLIITSLYPPDLIDFLLERHIPIFYNYHRWLLHLCSNFVNNFNRSKGLAELSDRFIVLRVLFRTAGQYFVKGGRRRRFTPWQKWSSWTTVKPAESVFIFLLGLWAEDEMLQI